SHGRSWELRKGVKITIQTHDLSNEGDQERQPSISADVWIIPCADLPRWAAAGQLAPLPESFKALDNPLALSDFLSTFREQLMQWDGKSYGLPLVGESPLCCYRADLLKAPAHQAALRDLFGRDLEGPVTWEQFAQLGEYFRVKGVDGRPGPSLPPLPQ